MMNNLTKIGETAFGTLYSFKGVIPFAFPDISSLNLGDGVVDNNGKGMRLCVNECWFCHKKVLHSMLVFTEFECADCHKKSFMKRKDDWSYDE